MPAASFLQVAGFERRFAVGASVLLPGCTGSAWRGGFGRTPRRIAGITDLKARPDCPVEACCADPYSRHRTGRVSRARAIGITAA